ncbi:MAG: type II secretion system F family protein [Alphaproteobacteria bacterium]|nr:type II secretion system F family protein [Alphaproteobacteria bacterium]
MSIALTPIQMVLIGITMVVLLVGVMIAVRISERQRRISIRLAAIRESSSDGPVETVTDNLPFLQSMAFRIGEFVRRTRILGPTTIKALEETVRAAGYRQSYMLGLFIGAKIMGIVFGPMVAWIFIHNMDLSTFMTYAIMFFALVLGMLLPDWILRKQREAYLSAVESGLPDGLDLLVICTESGLAFEGAIDRVGVEMHETHPELATEFSLTSAELRILPDRRQALINMGERTGLEVLKRFGGTLAQTLQYGTPLVQALRVLSNEMRQIRLTRFEERAARLPVLLTIPMILFILPCTFLIVGGPAGIQLMDALSK